MRKAINGLVYDTEKMTYLVSKNVYSNGNYAGEVSIRKTESGIYAIVTTSNGQDLHIHDDIQPVNKDEIAYIIDSWDIGEKETETLIAEGVLKNA